MSCLDMWVAAFDRLSEAIENWNACCEEVNTVPPGTDDIIGIDDTSLPPSGYDRDLEIIPPDFTDIADYDAYLCGLAHKVADTTDQAVDTIGDILLVASNILVFATLIVLAFGNIIGMGIAAILAGGYSLVTFSEIFGFFSLYTEARELLQAGDPSDIRTQTKAELASAHDEIVDAIYCSNTPQEARAAMHAVFDANVTAATFRGMLKLMFNPAFVYAMFAFEGNIADRFDCDCATLPETTFVATYPTERNWAFDCTQNMGGSDAFCIGGASGNQKMNPNAGGGFGQFGKYSTPLAGEEGFSIGSYSQCFYQYLRLKYTVGSLGNFAPAIQVFQAGSYSTKATLPGTPGEHEVTVILEEEVTIGSGASCDIRVRVPSSGSSNVNNQICWHEWEIGVLLVP